MKSTVENDRFSNHQLDGTRGWIVTAASFMSTFLTDGITFCFGLILFELVQVFDEPVEKVSWIPSFLLGIQLLSGKKNLLLSKLCDPFNPHGMTAFIYRTHSVCPE